MPAANEMASKSAQPKPTYMVKLNDRLLHKQVKLAALNKDMTVVQFVTLALRKALGQSA